MKQHYFRKPSKKLYTNKLEKAVCGKTVTYPMKKLPIQHHKRYTHINICKHCIKIAEKEGFKYKPQGVR